MKEKGVCNFWIGYKTQKSNVSYSLLKYWKYRAKKLLHHCLNKNDALSYSFPLSLNDIFRLFSRGKS